MDDSLWTAPDKKTLTDILQVANSFYKLNNICVNPSKSILVTNSETPDKTITFANDAIIAIEKRTPFKYLGAWFSLNMQLNIVQKIIFDEMILNLKKLQMVQITEKQAIYIINSVLLPWLQYRLYSSFLSTN